MTRWSPTQFRSCWVLTLLFVLIGPIPGALAGHAAPHGSTALAKASTASAANPPKGAPDVETLLRESLKVGEQQRKLAENYTWRETRILRKLDKDGAVKDQASKTYEVTLIDGEEHERWVLEDGEPLTPSDEKKEQQKLAKAIADRQSESAGQREKRLRKRQEEKDDHDRLMKAIPDAFQFRVIGMENVEGREAWKLEGTPRPGFRPFNRESGLMTKLRGHLWIDKQTLAWLRVDVETLDTISFGLFLARLSKGTTIRTEQQLVNGEVWVPRRTDVLFDARLALIRKMRGTAEILYSDYQRFSTDSKIVTTSPAEDRQSVP